MLEKLKEAVLEANLELVRRGLVLYTFGNASGISREDGLVVIKPSGVDYDALKPEHMVVTDLSGKIVEGKLNPSSDLKTHLELYKAFPKIGAVVHTHSENATAWAQARRDYVLNTGKAIIERFEGIDPLAIPAVLVAGHAPFAWGKDPHDAAHNAVVLEAVAKMAFKTVLLNSQCGVSAALLDRHYFRKHGAKATYGQGNWW